MCKPKDKAEYGSKHYLKSGEREVVFWWVEKGWASNENLYYYTKPTMMSVLGWKYSRPVDESTILDYSTAMEMLGNPQEPNE